MKKLFAGPWIGEFGWELFTWQAYIRAIAKGYDFVTVCSRPDRKFLYEDFADEFIPFIPSSNDVSMWACYNIDEKEILNLAPPPDVKWIEPRAFLFKLRKDQKDQIGLTPLQTFTPQNQKFISYGISSKDKSFDIVIHARNRMDKKAWPAKNWPIDYWEKLVTHFNKFRIACVGHPDASRNVPGTIDLRGIPLKELADILASSNLCVGASDGILNFAALCKTPRIIWTSQGEATKNIDRHTKCWNPFNIYAEVLSHPTWRPEPSIVIEAIEKYFE